MLEKLAQAPVARLATVAGDGTPHLVPICFAVKDRVLYFAVDAKPKRGPDLKRLRNIAANPRVAVLADHYEDDWRRLWWVRVDGTANVLDATREAGEAAEAVELLQRRYAQDRRDRPGGPVVRISIERVSGWSAS